MFLSLLFENPLIFVFVAGALVVSISVHEFAHAFIADKLGDPTPRYLGRVTLNPKAHLHPLGTLMLLFAGFGWGRPVPFNPMNLKNPKRDTAIIAFAGPCSNFLMAIFLSFALRLFSGSEAVQAFLYLTIFYNLILGFFNLLPIHPLDGFKVVQGFLPQNLAGQWQQMEGYGTMILLVLIITRSISILITPFINISMKLLGL